MADYEDIYELKDFDRLREQVTVATMVYVQAALAGTPTAADIAFSLEVLQNPVEWSKRITWLALADNVNAAVPAIQAVSDSVVQTNVNTACDALVGGF